MTEEARHLHCLGGAQAQAGARAAQQQEAVYRAALQELTLFKSRTSAALLQARMSMRAALRRALPNMNHVCL